MNIPKLIIIAGPNGCGKSTLAEILINKNQITTFLNADIIASGLGHSPKSEIESGRVLLKAIQGLLLLKQDIAFETTLSGKLWINLIQQAKELGYTVEIYFIFVDSPKLAVERVAERVSNGGHNIPTNTILRRFPRAINNFRNEYEKLADKWWLFNNTSKSAIMIASKPNGQIDILNKEQYQLFLKL